MLLINCFLAPAYAGSMMRYVCLAAEQAGSEEK